ncbi:MAG TPA: DUF1553 domain-containing protein [Pirellulales bacterium]|jgi:cytochrome c553|nr:DUF1553 domain-containing protein [Pirellulales bacterium]
MARLVSLLLLALAVSAAPPVARGDDDARAAEQFFESKVRPILVENCHKCHAGEKHKGNLRLDSLHAMLAGGDAGPAIVPGDPEHSLLLHVLSYSDDYVQMPPSKKLPDAQIAAIDQWVKLGAVWPGSERAGAQRPTRRAFEITDSDRAYWAFQPIVRPAPPAVKHSERVSNPIDAFIEASLDAKGLESNAVATPRELVRRATFDLTGLPPTPKAVAEFEADPSPKAYDALIDALLALPQYGERWGRHWLDVARFAQTNGYERDDEKPYAWRYRDYVIRAFNDDRPYDQFVLEQLAGDELPQATNDTLVATGFYRLGVWDDEPDDKRMADFDELDDVIVATGAAFMGLTIGCARCHDHMFDPIPQADYYRLLSFFRNVRPYDKPKYDKTSPNFAPLAADEMASRWFAEQQALIAPLEQRLKETKDKKEQKKLKGEIAKARDKRAPFEWALAVRENGGKPPKTNILIRGNAGTPGEEVEPAFLTVLGGSTAEIPAPDKKAASSGRRLALARWLVDPKNPLLARVMVNRVWKYHFGQGIAKTTSDFGRAGIPPTNPQLLDWLAAEFIGSGWSVKHLHRVIMRSAAYRRSSQAGGNAKAIDINPGNDLLWRQNLRRLEAEAIRDTVLAVSGNLNPKMGGRGFFPHLGGEVLAGASKPGYGWELSSDADRLRRSVYMFVKRTMVAPALDTFDYANTAQPLGERPVTTVAPQSLMLLNDDFMLAQAAEWADRLTKEAGAEPARQIDRAYRLAFGRAPTERETRTAAEYLARQGKAFAALGSRLTFRPEVPVSLDAGFLARLGPGDFLAGPRAGWTYYRGRWGGSYQNVVKIDPERGPFALWQGASLADGTITADVTLHNASELGSIIVRGNAEGDVFRGYEVRFDPRAGVVGLRRHGADVTLLGEAEMPIPTGKPLPVRIEMEAARLRVWAGSEPLAPNPSPTSGEGRNASEPILDITDPQPLGDAGQIGVRTWGAAMTLDHLTVDNHRQKLDVATASAIAAATVDAGEPLTGWDYFGGQWSRRADGGYAVTPSPGAKTVWQDVDLADGVVTAEVLLADAKGDAGLLVRVNQPSPGVDALEGYNINLRHNALRLGKHENNWRALVTAPMKLDADRWHHVRVQLNGPRVRVTVDDAEQPQIDYVDPNPLPGGKLGFRTFNASCAFRDLRATTARKNWQADFTTTQQTKVAATPIAPSPERRALEALCLVLFNLNELIYVD